MYISLFNHAFKVNYRKSGVCACIGIQMALFEASFSGLHAVARPLLSLVLLLLSRSRAVNDFFKILRSITTDLINPFALQITRWLEKLFLENRRLSRSSTFSYPICKFGTKLRHIFWTSARLQRLFSRNKRNTPTYYLRACHTTASRSCPTGRLPSVSTN